MHQDNITSNDVNSHPACIFLLIDSKQFFSIQVELYNSLFFRFDSNSHVVNTEKH